MSESEEVKAYHPVPQWLTEAYVHDVLRKYYKDPEITLLKLTCKPATAVSENYASVMTRIQLEFKDAKGVEHQTSYLVKTTHETNDLVADLFAPYHIYTREMSMYEHILPKLNKLLQEIGSTEKLYANTIYVDYEHASIIFEDLLLQHFVTGNRVERLDLAHTKMILSKLAKLHATSAVLNERNPGIFAKNFDRGFFSRRTEAYKPVHLGILKSLLRYVESQPKLKILYYHKLSALLDRHMENGARVYDVNEDDFMTLIHGDAWVSNIMFRYDKRQNPCEVIPIDYQFSTWCSPTLDLHYLFNTSMPEELREHKQPELLQYYYYILVDTLKLFKYQGKIPSLYKFNMEFQARSYMAVFASFVFQPCMIYNGPHKICIENLVSDSEYSIIMQDSMFENVAVQKYVHQLLPVFDQKGLLDNMY